MYKNMRETGGVCMRVLERDCEGETDIESVYLCVCGRETCIKIAKCLIAAHANVFKHVCVYIHHHCKYTTMIIICLYIRHYGS